MDPLARLFGSAARLKLLRLFLFNDDSAFGLVDAAFRAKVEKEAARKEIHVLLSAGILRRRLTNGDALYQAERKFPFYEALLGFIRATTMVGDGAILTSLRKTGTLRLVVLTGLFTGALEPKVDVLIVGDHLDERKVKHAIHALEAELGRELRYGAFSTEDFRYRVGVYDRLVRDVFDYSHRILLDRIGMKD